MLWHLVTLWQSVSVSLLCLMTSLSLSLCIYPFIYLSIYPSIHPSIHLFMYIWPSIYLHTSVRLASLNLHTEYGPGIYDWKFFWHSNWWPETRKTAYQTCHCSQRYPGQGFEQFMESIVSGGDLLGYKAWILQGRLMGREWFGQLELLWGSVWSWDLLSTSHESWALHSCGCDFIAAVGSLPWNCQAEKKKQATGCSAAMHIEAPVEDRNRIWVWRNEMDVGWKSARFSKSHSESRQIYSETSLHGLTLPYQKVWEFCHPIIV